MKYEVKHTCGHASEVSLYGKQAERDRKLAWMATQPCRECEAAARKARHEAENAAAAATNIEAGLPALIGSEKQIAWAESIRADFRTGWNATWMKAPEAACPILNGIINRLMAEASAKWWIETAREIISRDNEGGIALTGAFLKAIILPDEMKAMRAAK